MRALRLQWFLLAAGTIFAALALAIEPQNIDDNVLKNAGKNGGDWLTVGLNYAEQRYSPLKQIDTSNVGRLSLAWTFDVGPGGGQQEATPLVANGVIYGITNWSITFAVDARTHRELWRYDPKVDHSIDAPGSDRICCGVVNRGVALYEGKVIVPVIDGRLVALDAATGKEVWSVLAIPKDSISHTLTMAPRVIKGRVIIGTAGGEFPPFRGYFAAFDAKDGKEIWRFYTVPGDPSRPFENKAMEIAAKTWTGKWWELGGGGSIWDGLAYDPETNLVYVGTGNGTPWSYDVRQGKSAEHLDNLYIASIVAVDVDTGQLKWYFQCTPAEQWDYDAVQHLILADLRINGRERKAILQANKNGFFYVIDRVSGEFISAAPFSQVSWLSSMDPKTGRPIIAPEAYYSSEKGVTVAPVQGHGWAQMAFNPTTGLVYFPAAQSSTFNFTAAEKYLPTPGNQNFGLKMVWGAGAPPLAKPPVWGHPLREIPQDQRGAGSGILSAWDPATQKERWYAPGGGPNGGGVLTTAGNLVFQVLGGGRLIAYSADKGEKLLEINIGQNSMGPPMTYMVDGKQYVAVMGGQGARPSFGMRGGPPPGAPPGGPSGHGDGPPEPGASPAPRANAPPTMPPMPPMPPASAPKLYVYAVDAQ
jgi:quinohemoprotein ethanol dehydrogenase